MTDPSRCIPSPPCESSQSKVLALEWIQYLPIDPASSRALPVDPASSRALPTALGWIQHLPVPFSWLWDGSSIFPCLFHGSGMDAAAGESRHSVSVMRNPTSILHSSNTYCSGGLLFFPHLPEGLFLYGEVGEPEINPASLPCRLPLAFPEPPLRGLRALLKTSLFPHVCRCNLCTMLLLVEKQGLYLRGNYTCRNPALSLPA